MGAHLMREHKIDVVIPLGLGSRWEDNELRFCLRALQCNFLDLGKVWIVGEKPEWCVNVHYLRVPDFFSGNKDANLITKIMTACYQQNMSPTSSAAATMNCCCARCDSRRCGPTTTARLATRVGIAGTAAYSVQLAQVDQVVEICRTG